MDAQYLWCRLFKSLERQSGLQSQPIAMITYQLTPRCYFISMMSILFATGYGGTHAGAGDCRDCRDTSPCSDSVRLHAAYHPVLVQAEVQGKTRLIIPSKRGSNLTTFSTGASGDNAPFSPFLLPLLCGLSTSPVLHASAAAVLERESDKLLPLECCVRRPFSRADAYSRSCTSPPREVYLHHVKQHT